MSFTRKFDDRESVKCRLDMMSAASCYMLQEPGNGTRPAFVTDPHIRLQKWGANLRTGCPAIDSGLRGLGIPLTRDCNNRLASQTMGTTIEYPTASAWTDETRATHPAWWYREKCQDRSQHLFVDPQQDAEKRMWMSLSTRDMARDAFDKMAKCSP